MVFGFSWVLKALVERAGLQAIDEIVPTLLHTLEDNKTFDTVLMRLKVVALTFTLALLFLLYYLLWVEITRFVKFQKDGYAKIWVMPRYGDADSIPWFEVQPHWTFYRLNYFEDDNEVVVRGCSHVKPSYQA
ncbi:hypothetical protein QYF36_001143 [Acer negundo]|nr:hypothetical protein QYF36_001143 [Acer negundo]